MELETQNQEKSVKDSLTDTVANAGVPFNQTLASDPIPADFNSFVNKSSASIPLNTPLKNFEADSAGLDAKHGGYSKNIPQTATKKNPFKKEKVIDQTFGGKWMKVLVDWGWGFGANSAMSGGIVYYINPLPSVKKFKKSLNGENSSSTARYAIEILSAYIAGIIATVGLSIIGPFREKIAYKINQLAGKDTDVKTEEMRHKTFQPQTAEEKINYFVDELVNEKMNWKDVWKARILGMAIILPGNQLLGRLTRFSEKKTSHSLDTGVWKLGGWFYDQTSRSSWGKDKLDWLNAWFTKHGAGVEDIRERVEDSYYRLEQVETHGKIYEPDLKKAEADSKAHPPAINDTRVATREFFRTMFGVEIPWTILMAGIVAKKSRDFRDNRVAKEKAVALNKIKHTLELKGKVSLKSKDGRVFEVGQESLDYLKEKYTQQLEIIAKLKVKNQTPATQMAAAEPEKEASAVAAHGSDAPSSGHKEETNWTRRNGVTHHAQTAKHVDGVRQRQQSGLAGVGVTI